MLLLGGLAPFLIALSLYSILLSLYFRFGATPHFFLHTLMGWDVALLLLLTATYFGGSSSRWDGLVLLMLALYALTPDFIYAIGPYHRDWMDIFLLHTALDEILPVALPILVLLWIVLLAGYTWFRTRPRVEP
jgi:hypothetical protein